MMRNRWFAVLWTCVAWLCLGASFAQAEPIDDYNSALKSYEQKKWRLASRGFEAFLSKAATHPKAPLAQLYLGQSLTHSQDYTAARNVFRKFLESHPQHTDAPLAAYRIGESSYFLNDSPAASQELEYFVKTYPNHDLAVWGWQYLGEARLQLKDAAGAVQAFEVVLKLKTDINEQVEAKFFLAQAYEAMQQKDQAAALYKEVAAAEHPRASEALFGLASAEYDANRYEDAAKMFEDLSTRFPQHSLAPRAELNAGFSRYQTGDYVAAEKQFEAAAKHAEHTPTATFWIGMSRKMRSDWAGAAGAFAGLAGQSPAGELADKTSYHWADCLSHLDQYEQAQKLFLSLAEKSKDPEKKDYGLYDDSHYSAADVTLRSKNLAEAIQLSEQFPIRFPHSPLLTLNDSLLGRAHIARGDEAIATDMARAQADFQKAAGLFRNVIATSSVPRTTNQARVLLSRAEKRLHHPDKVIEALTPLAEAINKGEAGSADYADVLPTLGEALLDVGQSNQAETILQQAVKSLPPASSQRPTTLMKLAEVQAALGKWTEMDTTLDELALVNTSGNLLAQSAYANADRAIEKKEWDAAQKLLSRVIALGESSNYYVPALSDLGTVQASQGQHANAAATFRKLVSSDKTDVEVRSTAAYNLGICLEQDAAGDPEKLAAAATALAEGAHQFAIPKDKVLPDVIEQKVAVQAAKCARRGALIQAKLNHLDEADKLWQIAYDQIGKLQPADQDRERPDALLHEWAGYHFNAKDTVRADELFAQLYQNYPTSEYADDSRLFVAQGHDEAGRDLEARELYKTFEKDTAAGVETRQKALLSWMNLESRLRNWEESQRIAALVIQEFGSSEVAFDARFSLGESQIQRGDFENAAKTLAALRSDPALPATATWRPDLELLWSESLFRQQDYVGVEQALTAFLATNPAPQHADQAHELLGRTEYKQAHFEAARTHCDLVVNSATSAKSELAAKAQSTIGDSFLLEKNYDQAMVAYQNLVVNYSLPEYQAPALLQLAKCEMTTKDWAAAKTSLERLIADFPDTSEAKQAAQDLLTVRKNLPASDTP